MLLANVKQVLASWHFYSSRHTYTHTSLYMYMIVAVLVLMPVIYIVYTTPPVMGVLIGIIALKLSMGLLCWSGSS
jgi:hypothetical protein